MTEAQQYCGQLGYGNCEGYEQDLIKKDVSYVWQMRM
jgi:hypothetical protein